MAIQLELFDVAEFLEKSSHPFHVAMRVVKRFNFYMRLYAEDSQKQTDFFDSHIEENKRMVAVALKEMVASVFIVRTWSGNVPLLPA